MAKTNAANAKKAGASRAKANETNATKAKTKQAPGKVQKKQIKPHAKHQDLGEPSDECQAYIVAMVRKNQGKVKGLWEYISTEMAKSNSPHLAQRTGGSMRQYYSIYLNPTSRNKRRPKGDQKASRASQAIERAGGVKEYIKAAVKNETEWWWWNLDEAAQNLLDACPPDSDDEQ